MFTGIVRTIGIVRSVAAKGDSKRFEIEGELADADLQIGASVLHSGICLTIAERPGDNWIVEAAPKTLEVTSLANWRVGSRINLEPALRLGDPLGGHLLFGHVDETTRLLDMWSSGESRRLRLAMSENMLPMIAARGSVALDGVSLTVADCGPDWFEVTLIAHTSQTTILGLLDCGDSLNLELDMIARYVALAGGRGKRNDEA